jgi:hypothetical protein
MVGHPFFFQTASKSTGHIKTAQPSPHIETPPFTGNDENQKPYTGGSIRLNRLKSAPPIQILKETFLTIVFNPLIKSRIMGWTGYVAGIEER